MVTVDFCKTMARYNRWQNSSLFAASDALSDDARREDRGSFFGSIHRTLSHLAWGDTIWMSRFDGWERPECGIPESPVWITEWDALQAFRGPSDERIIAWADALTSDRLAGDLTWFSGASGREQNKPLALCVVHFFNHQTHHRGQVHSMLTAAGATPEATDLFLMSETA